MLICPGWCGEQFVGTDAEKNWDALQKHLLRCPKGHATMSLMGKYTEWLTAENLLVGPQVETGQNLAGALPNAYLIANPPTDPRVMYSTEMP